MPLVDNNGNLISPDKVKGQFKSYPVTSPSEARDTALGALGRILPRVGTMTAGEYYGGLIGEGVAGPPGAIVGGVVGGGVGNLAGKYLPEAIGGEPNRSAGSAFAWGAGPSAIANTLGVLRKLRLSGFLKEATAKQFADEEKAILDAAKAARTGAKLPAKGGQDVADIMSILNAKPQATALDAEARRQVTFPLRDAITGPIYRMRQQWGAPLKAAYESLKGQDPLSEDDARELAQALQGVRGEMLSPAPQIQAIINKTKRWLPAERGGLSGGTDISGMSGDELEALPGGTFIKHGNAPPTAESLRLQGFTEKQIAEIVGADKGKPPTLDEIRELRQVVNERLRTAQGGNVHGLAALQSRLDDVLVNYLPDDWSDLRANYKSFSDQFRYSDINRLRRAPDPETVADWMFNPRRKPSFTREIISHATDKEKELIRQGFDTRLLSSLNFNASGETEFTKLNKLLEPYLRNGVINDLFGPAAGAEVVKRMFLPQHMEALFKQLGTPTGQQLFDQRFLMAARTLGASDRDAAMAGFQALYDNLSPADKARFAKAAGGRPSLPNEPLAQLSQTPRTPLTPESAKLKGGRAFFEGQATKAEKRAESEGRASTYAGTYLLTDLAMGKVPFAFMGARLLTAGGAAIRRNLLNVALKTGNGAKLIDFLNARPGQAGALFLQLLAAIGAQAGQKAFPAKAEPVEGVPHAP